MELPQPRPFETEGRKPTHDFLSQYNHPNIQQDPRPPSQGRYLKTHDFLQPLERVEKDNAKEETSGVEILASEKLPPPPVAQHVLPGGIGTYTISHVSYFNQRLPKVEEMSPMFTVVQADSNERNTAENSNCSSYTSGGFTLWEESVEKKGHTRKENVGARLNTRAEVAANIGQWSTSELPSQSSTNNHQNHFGSLSSPLISGKKSQSFIEMIRSAKDSSQDDDLDDDEEFSVKKESSSTTQKAHLIVKVGGNKAAGSDQRPSTPRSKHSATEQRRRSKINDGFQKLRQLIPISDQKRDKASFLLEVIEYIQFLQEKVNKYESSYQGWNHEPGKQMNWRNNQGSAEVYMDQPRGIDSRWSPTAVYTPKLEEKTSSISQVTNCQNRLDLLDMNSSQTARLLDPRPGTVNKAMPFPLSHQLNFFSPVLPGSSVPRVTIKQATEPVNNTTSRNQTQPGLNPAHGADAPAASDKLKEQELATDAGTISISSVYSQELLKTLTQALQSSGVDLSQTSISVQIELAKNRDNRTSSSPVEENEFAPKNQRTSRPRTDAEDDFNRNPKKAKTDGN